MSSLPKPLGQPWSGFILPQNVFNFVEQLVKIFRSSKRAKSDRKQLSKQVTIGDYEIQSHSCANLSFASGDGSSRNGQCQLGLKDRSRSFERSNATRRTSYQQFTGQFNRATFVGVCCFFEGIGNYQTS